MKYYSVEEKTLTKAMDSIRNITEENNKIGFDSFEENIEKVYNKGQEHMYNLWFNRALTEIPNEAEITTVLSYQFHNMTELENVSLPLATSLETGAFYGCSKLENIYLPVAETISDGALRNSSLFRVDLPKATSIGATCFYYTNICTALILRNNTICTLANKNSLNGTRIAGGTGYIYVPSALLEEYKEATNWSVYADQFRAIEDYPNLDNENALQIIQQPQDLVWRLGHQGSFTVEAIGDGLKYRWFIDEQEGNGWVTSSYNTRNDKTHTIFMSDGRQKWRFYCEVSDDYGHVVRTNAVQWGLEE